MTQRFSPTVPSHLPIVPAEELAGRAARFGDRMRHDDLDGAFLLHPSSHFWISGTLGDGWPFVDADGSAFLPLRTSVGRAQFESSLPLAPVRRLAEVPAALTGLGATVGGVIGLRGHPGRRVADGEVHADADLPE